MTTRASSEFRRIWGCIRNTAPVRLRNIPRPGYCHCCGSWQWLTNETPAYSAYDGAYLCEECAGDNDVRYRISKAIDSFPGLLHSEKITAVLAALRPGDEVGECVLVPKSTVSDLVRSITEVRPGEMWTAASFDNFEAFRAMLAAAKKG